MSNSTCPPKWQRYTCITLVIAAFIMYSNDFSLLLKRNPRRLDKDQLLLMQQNQSMMEEENSTTSLSKFNPIQEKQIANYIRGEAVMYNIHVTHHGGTTFCGVIGHANGIVPSFACMGPSAEEAKNIENGIKTTITWPPELDARNWFYKINDDTDQSTITTTTNNNNNKMMMSTAFVVDQFRKYNIHMMTTEYRCHGPLNMDWENENLLTVFIMRHPIDRFLAGGKCGKAGKQITILEAEMRKQQSQNNNATTSSISPDLWWEYANDDCTDNCALRVLSNDSKNCCQGANTSRFFLERAKQLLKRLTFVLDISCLDESMLELGNILNLTSVDVQSRAHLKKEHPSARERIANDTLYNYLMDKFRLDIELYEWSKQISLVKC